jgi:TonB-linked SusC/RagA family outer membrane protein
VEYSWLLSCVIVNKIKTETMLVLKRYLPTHIGLFCFLFLLNLQTFSQSTTLSGTVLNAADNTPVAGVSVVQQGSEKGTTTNNKGFFTLTVTGSKLVLVFSSVGYQAYTLTWDGTSSLAIKLEPEASSLQDVVVVGYGTQKKVNQTGATQTLKLSESVNQPVTNSGQLMYGKFSGVQLTQGTGLPGADGSSITIRGIGSFGSTTPLIVIDNIQYESLTVFNSLAPSDIESISVLKDASAGAIYGARGANGVVIVTTKKGKSGSMNVVYNNYFGFQEVTVVPKYLNAMDYATLMNEALFNRSGALPRYSPANILAMRDGTDPDRFANTNWANEILRRAPIQNHYISFSGGNDKTTYRASFGYLNQEAVVKGKFKSNRYNMSLNLNSQLKKWLSISNSFNGYWSRFTGPTGGAGAITGETGIINQFQRSTPTVPVYYSSGEYGTVDGVFNASFPITNAIRRGQLGTSTSDDLNFANRFGVTVNITKDLSFETSGSFNIFTTQESDFVPRNKTVDWAGQIISEAPINSLSNTTAFNYRLLNENILRYHHTFKSNHDFSVLLGHSVQYGRNDGFSGSLKNFPTDGLQEFDAGGVLEPNIGGGASEFALQSLLSRINYIYDGKYLFEFNMRRDASSRFSSANRYGNFPSASVGWRLSQEKFLSRINWLSDLKVRASWGITGNDNIDNYLYAQTYNVSLDYFLGTGIVSGAALTRLANPNVKWETIKQYDIGVDAGFFRNKLSLTADYFNRESYDLLYSNFPVPASIGVSNLAAINAASMLNRGIEVVLNYRDRLKGGFNYSVGGSITKFADNEVTGLGDRGLESISGVSIVRVGVPYNAYYGYKAIGIFQTTDEITNSPKQFNNPALTKPGDIKYADISGANGKPDGVINEQDRTVIGNPYPSWVYNFNANIDYKGFDMNVVFEGLGNVDRIFYDNGQLPFEGDRNNGLTYWINRWTPANPSTKLPRLGGYSNALISTFYIQDASYLRMKNLEIGYSLPASLTNKVGISKLRVFLSGQNILTFTKLENFDPERARGRNTDQNVPLYKVYTFGVNVKF